MFDLTQQTALSLLRSSLWGADSLQLSPSKDSNWNAIYQELCEQTVDGLATDLLAKFDPEHRITYVQKSARKISFWYTLMEEQQIICGLLLENGISCAILKGSAAAIYYPAPTYRTMGDIDIIVSQADFGKAHQLLLDSGAQVIGKDNGRHVELTRNGIVIELHRYFSIFKQDAHSQLLDRTILSALNRTHIVSLEGFSFPMLPPLENGLVLLAHISHHMEHGLGLRQIIDWMLYVDRELPDEVWISEFQPIIQELGLTTLAVTVTRMCQLYLGLRQDITWCQTADPELCQHLMIYILDQGNFGRKRGGQHNQAMETITAARNLPQFARRLYHHGVFNWVAAQKHRWLKPLAPFYQIGRYINQGLRREKPFLSLWQDLHQSRHQDAFLDRLGALRYKSGIATPEALRTDEDNTNQSHP